jgi:hypothetical protein
LHQRLEQRPHGHRFEGVRVCRFCAALLPKSNDRLILRRCDHQIGKAQPQGRRKLEQLVGARKVCAFDPIRHRLRRQAHLGGKILLAPAAILKRLLEILPVDPFLHSERIIEDPP